MFRVPVAAGAFAVGLSLIAAVHAQSTDDLRNDHRTPGDVLTYGMGYSQQRHSPLTQVNRGTVKRLIPVWSHSTANVLGDESQPLVHDGVMYVTTSRSTFAIDAVTGKGLWRHDIEYESDVARYVCCGQVSRGAAMYQGKLIRTTLDAHVVALDAKTGKELWNSRADDYKQGYSMTVAPLVANGVVITGVAGAEFGTRGYLDGWDAETGKQLWRRHVVPAPGEKGAETWPSDDTWKYGGGSTWVTGSYDPELDLVYWGTGNPGPWSMLGRPGDNLYTCAVIAIRPRTGEMVWHYQFTPNDPADYDGVNEMVQAELQVDGRIRKVLMHADRNGFLYVLDRASGELIAANAYVKVTWADGVDLKTGRPVVSAATAKLAKGEETELWPSITGGKNWQPMAFSPATGLIYANTINGGMSVQAKKIEHKFGGFYSGLTIKRIWPDSRGYLKALDPLTGKAKWEVPFPIPNFAGVLSTAGGLVFTGTMTGEFMAFDADTGQRLWQFQTGSGIIGQPITWERNGRQYVTVATGIGGVYALHARDERLRTVPAGGAVWTFALFE